jgi:hypothetical protein
MYVCWNLSIFEYDCMLLNYLCVSYVPPKYYMVWLLDYHTYAQSMRRDSQIKNEAAPENNRR